MRTKEQIRFELIGNIIMVILTVTALVPIVLMIISSLTDDATLIKTAIPFSRKSGVSELTTGYSVPTVPRSCGHI
jgi:putative aldouronate transport system permease protein